MNFLLVAATFAVAVSSVTLPNSLAVSAQDAAVQPMPNYDVATSCAKSKYAMLGEDFCYQMHYMNREATSDIWLRTSAPVRAECITIANRFGDYGMLARCIRSHANDAKVQ